MEGNLQHSGKKFLAKLSKLHSNFTWDYTAGINFFDHGVFDSFSNAEKKKISLLSKSSRQVFQNCILRVQRNRLRRKIFFFLKKQLFECFETLAKNFRPLIKKSLGRIAKTAIYLPKEGSPWDFDSDKLCLFFILGHWAKRNQPSGKFVPEKKNQNCIQCFQKSILWEKFSLDKVLFKHFCTWAKEYQSFVIFPRQDFQNCFLRVQRDLLGKKFFWMILICFFLDIERRIIGFLSTGVRQDCRICNLLAYGIISKWKYFFWNKFLSALHPPILSQKNGPMAFFFGKMSKLQIKFPKVNSEEENSIETKSVFSFFFGHLAENCQTVETFSAGISKLHSMFSKQSDEETLVFSNCLHFFKKILWICAKIVQELCFMKTIFFSFPVNEQKFIGFCRFFFRMVVKTAFYMPMGSFWEKTILS